MQSPNILFIMADQLQAPALPFYGHPLVKTPHLSALAKNGVVFENAYCNSPLCAPSRFSMMAGQLASRIAAYDNAAYFPTDIPTIAHYLRSLGYYTCLSGKMHFIGTDQLHGFEERLTTDIYPADFAWTVDWDNFEKRPSWYHNLLSVVQAGTCETSNQLDYDDETGFHAVRKIYELARRPNPNPFFLTVSFTHPHDPYAISEEYWNRYQHEDIDMPTIPPIPYEDLDPHSQRLFHVCALGDYAQTEERVRNARHAYYGMVSYIDDKVGQLIQALEKTGQKDNTVIVFTSDHGDMLGERGLWYKMSFFEQASQVPLLFHAPNKWASQRIKTPVSLLDLLPTLVDISNKEIVTPCLDMLDGKSLKPYLENPSEGTNTVYGEILAEGSIAPLLMIRRDQYKYIYCELDPEQLYDVEKDPHELNNLAQQADFQKLRQNFYEEVHQKWNPKVLYQEILDNQRRRRFVHSALSQGTHVSWDFQPHQDASQRYMRSHMDLNVLERTSRFPSPEIPPKDGVNVQK